MSIDIIPLFYIFLKPLHNYTPFVLIVKTQFGTCAFAVMNIFSSASGKQITYISPPIHYNFFIPSHLLPPHLIELQRFTY
jgi:hypothetical protein